MAQHFYHVLSPNDKVTTEVARIYPNEENVQPTTVQYVIAPTPAAAQQFQQQVVVSSDDLMVVDSSQEDSVILDQTVQTPYIIQKPTFQENHQQVYYMTSPTRPTQQIIVEQPIITQEQPTTVVVNHFMPHNLNKAIGATSHLIQTSDTIGTQIIQEKPPLRKLQQRGNIIGVRAALAPQQQKEETGLSQYKKFVVAKTLPPLEKIGMAAPGRKLTPRGGGTSVRGVARMPRVKLQSQPRLPAPNVTITPDHAQMNHPQPGSIRGQFNRNLQHTQTHQQKMQQTSQIIENNRQQQQQPQNTNGQYLIQLPKNNQNRQPKPLPAFLHTSQIQNIIANTPVNEEYTDSIRMLVLLDNGEQRLITFTLPKEACTIQEILEQVGVPYQDTPIQVIEVNSNGLHYIVTVGHVPYDVDQKEDEKIDNQTQHPQISQSHAILPQQQKQIVESTTPVASPPPPAPSPPKEIPPKLIPGKLAVCPYCGYSSEDFNKCIRCTRKLPENVKSLDNTPSNVKKIGLDKKLPLPKPNGTPKLNLLQRRRPIRSKFQECETVVVSSDDEDSNDRPPTKNDPIMEKLGTSVTISPITKEPTVRDMAKLHTPNLPPKAYAKIPDDQVVSTTLTCRTIRIGSYKFVPPEPVRIDSNGITIKVPHPHLKPETIIKSITICTNDVVKVLICFQKSLPVLFYYIHPSAASIVRTALDMTNNADYYFDPLSETEESHRRITLLPEVISEQSRNVLLKIYSKSPTAPPNIFDELTYKEANDILIKTCPKELARTVIGYRLRSEFNTSMLEVKQLLMYPPEGRGRISINTEDYMCLAQEQFLNDVIIDFYLKYLVHNLPKEQQEKVHVFSTFFYKRLTTKPLKASRKNQPTELDPNLTPAQKRHARVKTWTKNVNIFEKDFIIIPINENSHWFLAIICFPWMNGSQTMDSGQPIKIEPKQPRKKKIAIAKEKIDTIMCEDGDRSDKDEAEGDDSELDSDDSDDSNTSVPTVENNSSRPPIKQPCILIFDSLAGASRCRVVATLRDYLTCEYAAKMNEEKIFNKDVIKGACPKVPQQNNFTDCGLYVLQYVEQFFKDPIKDYYIPISHLKNWFEEITVTKKREDISLLIKSLMKEYNKDLSLIPPDVVFPTLNGELVEHPMEESDDKFFEPDEEGLDEEEMEEDEEEEETVENEEATVDEEEKMSDESSDKTIESTSSKFFNSELNKISDSNSNKNSFEEQVVGVNELKPDLSELPRQSNKDTLSYLKAKRIIRHKMNSGDAPDSKKTKIENATTSS